MGMIFESWGASQWFLVAIVIFAVGHFFGKKDDALNAPLELFRMLARHQALYPKLAPKPNWLKVKKPKHHVFSDYDQKEAGMMMQYYLLCDDWRLPQACYVVQDNQWRQVDFDEKEHKAPKKSPMADMLSGQMLPFDALNPFVFALATNGNCIVLFWHDDVFVHQNKPTQSEMNDVISHLKQALTKIANGLTC